MRSGYILLLIFISAFFFTGCKKEDEYIAPTITINTPDVGSMYNLPGKMFVEIDISSEHDIKFVRASVDNSNLYPIFGTSFFYPEDRTAKIAFTLSMDVIPSNSSPPYYLHIAVDDGLKLTHKYLEVTLNNAPLKYKGFNLVTCTNKTYISRYDTDNVENKTVSVNGGFGDAAASIANQFLYLSTSNPDKLYAFEQDELEVKWEKEPEMPFPYYTDLKNDENFLFVGYGNERIDAFDGNSGFLQLGTSILVDSVPKEIGVADSYFVGYFEKRTGPSKALVSFYLATGSSYNKLETDIEVLEFYSSGQTNVLNVFGNRNGNGIITSYFFDDNKFGDMTVISEGLITNSCHISLGLFLISIENKVYDVVHNTNYIDLKFELPDNVIDLQYDKVNKVIYVAVSTGVYIYRYPDYAFIDFISSENPVKAVRLIYGY